jgi:hypothetical protein
MGSHSGGLFQLPKSPAIFGRHCGSGAAAISLPAFAKENVPGSGKRPEASGPIAVQLRMDPAGMEMRIVGLVMRIVPNRPAVKGGNC